MKIVHVIYSFNVGGSETMLVDIINRQTVNHKLSLIIVNDSINEDLIQKLDTDIEVIRLNRKPSSRSLWPIIKLNYYLKRIKPDIIHLHSYTLPKIVFRKGKGIWYTAHALGIPMKYADRLQGIIAISQAVKDDIQNRCDTPIVLIPNGIDMKKIQYKEKHNIGDKFRIIQVGRLDYTLKGQDILIKSVAELIDSGITDISVDFIGAGESESYLKNLTHSLKVENNVNFLGLKDRKYIYSHLKDYDLMCHPARKEGFGLTVAEGMAAKLPVLVSMEGGPWEIIKNGKYGMGFISEDIDDCASKILEIKQHYEELAYSIEEAYSYVNSNYSIEKMVDKYLEAYENYCQ